MTSADVHDPYTAPGSAAQRPALLRHRTLAAAVDVLVICGMIAIASVIPLSLAQVHDVHAYGFSVLDAKWLWAVPVLVLTVPVAYHIVSVARYSTTVGKWLFSMQVVSSDERRIGYGRSALRYFASWFSSLLFFAGYWAVRGDKDRRTFHDRLSDTKVICR